MEPLKPLLSKEDFLDQVKRMKNEMGISDRALGEPHGLPQSAVWGIFHGERGLLYEEAQEFVETLLMVRSPIPHGKSVKDLAITGDNLKWANSGDLIKDVARLMFDKGFSQLPVRGGNGAFSGVVTEYSLMKRMLSPEKGSEIGWIKKLGEKTLGEAGVIETVPTYGLDEPLRVVAQAMAHYPAILVGQMGKVTGILTRADFIRFLFDSGLE